MVPWLTLRGLHTDRREGFSADHRLAFRASPLSASWFESLRLPRFPFVVLVPPGYSDGCHRRSSPWPHLGFPVLRVRSLGSLLPASGTPLLAVRIRPRCPWLGSSLQPSRGAVEPSGSIPRHPTPWLPARPSLTPLTAGVLGSEGCSEGSGCPADLVLAVPGPIPICVVSRACEHGSLF